MKILIAAQMKCLDDYTIQHEPVSSIDLMERAANKLFEEFFHSLPAPIGNILVFCGTGNNGGDGFAVARMLAHAGVNVTCFLSGNIAQLSDDCAINNARFENISKVESILSENDFPSIKQNETVIDAFSSHLILVSPT